MFKRLKVKLYPTEKQKIVLNNHMSVYRYCYNLSLDYKKTLWADHKKNISGYDMAKELLAIRKETPWMNECKAECVREACYQVDKAYKGFFKGKGFPRFKSKKGEQSFHAYQSIRVIENKVRFYKNDISLKTSNEYLEKLHSHKVKQVTFKRDLTGDYWASFLIDDKNNLELPITEDSVGIDLGLSHLLITSDGEYFENNKFLRSQQYQLRKLQRRFAKTNKGGKNREKLKQKIAKKHRNIKWQKEHYYHQITNKLIRENKTIAIETLRVKNMMKNHKLARAISDASWGMLVQMLEYKCNWYGRELVKIDTFFPSSKQCSNCNHIKEELKLSEREWICIECEKKHNRDFNASQNILNEGLRIIRDKNTRSGLGGHANRHPVSKQVNNY